MNVADKFRIVAVTLTTPAVAGSVSTVPAIPDEFVTAVLALSDPPPAPIENVTVAPGTGS
jgi:hypothetical protein